MMAPKAKRRKRALASCFSGLASTSLAATARAQSADSTYASQARWGQAWTTLPDPALLVYGGMVSGNGQTFTSAPPTNDLLYLPLNSSFSGTSAPWQLLAGSEIPTTSQGPPTSWGALAALTGSSSSESVLLFGGESSSVAVQTGNDSDWTVALSPTSSVLSQSSTSTVQPMRRIRHTLSSAYSLSTSLAWLYGGLKADGSGIAFSELWQYSSSASSPASGTWSTCASGPEAVYDHAAVTTASADGSTVQLWFIGGATPGVGGGTGMADLGTLTRFTPDLASSGTACSGTWDNVTISGAAPSPRRGHSVVALSSTQMLLFGGASQSGSTVYSDTWLLDVAKGSWTELSPSGQGPSARWGHCMARVGSSVVITMGYGTINGPGPADSAVWVYDVSSSKWDTNFAPSVAPPSATLKPSATGATSASQAVTTGQSAASQPAASESVGTAAPAPSASGWQTPGSSDPAPSPLSSSSDKSSSPSLTVIGLTVGLFGIVALVGGAAYYFYRRRQQATWRVEAAAYRRRVYGSSTISGKGPSDIDGDSEGLVHPNDQSLHVTGGLNSPRNVGVGVMRNARPAGHGLGLGAVSAGVGALWAGRQQRRLASGGRKQRFDMLADEESDVWDADAGGSDDEMEELRSRPSTWMAGHARNKSRVSARDGPQIWEGLEDGSPQLGYGTATSFLGASLAPWSDDGHSRGVSELGSAEDYRDPFASISTARGSNAPGTGSTAYDQVAYETGLTPAPKRKAMPSWSSPPASPGTRAMSIDSHATTSSVPPSNSTLPTTAASSAASCNAVVGLDVLSPAMSSASSGLNRSSTWWDRIRSQGAGGVASPGSLMPIRDPAPAPSLAVIPESSKDPFADDASATTTSGMAVDEHGRSYDGGHFVGESQGSAQTATSSMIELATQDMMVVQRLRTGSSGMDEPQTPSEMQETEGDETPRTSDVRTDDDSEEGQVQQAQRWERADRTPDLGEIGSPQGDVVWNGPSMWMSPTPSDAAMADMLSPAFLIASPPPTLVSSGAVSPKPRGPRQAPPEEQPRRAAAPPTRKQTAGTTGVRAMVQQFEQHSGADPVSSPSTPERSTLSRSVAGSVSSSHGSGAPHSGGRPKGQKLEHGLVRKPVLYVANPDEA